MTLTGNLIISAGGFIDVTDKGFLGDNGPGTATGGTTDGGSYGGIGGDNGPDETNLTNVYGTITAPTDLGSGGDNSQGGGAVTLL